MRRPRDRRAARARPRGGRGRRGDDDGTGSRGGNLLRAACPRPPEADRSVLLCAHLDTVPHEGVDRAGAGGRRLGERRRHDPRRRQQGRRRGAAGAGPAAASSRARRSASSCCSPSARRTRWRAPRRSTSRPLRRSFGYVFDHATPIGEIVVALADLLPPRGATSAAAPRTPASGPRTAAARSLAAARAIAAMRLGRLDERDDRERRLDPRRRRPGPTSCPTHCSLAGRGALARRRERRGGRGRDGRPLPRRGQRARVRVRRRRDGRAAVRRLSPSARRPAVAAAEARAARPAATSPRGSSPAAARTPTRSRPRASPARTSPTAPSATTSRPSASAVAALEGMLDVTFALLDARRRAVTRARPAPRDGGGGGAGDGRRAAPGRRRRRAAGRARRSPTSALVGPREPGDEVVVNTQARDLGARLGRLRHRPREPHARPGRRRAWPGAHVMKLNYTLLQHAVLPVEGAGARRAAAPPGRRVLAARAARAARLGVARRGAPRRRLGYVQTAGGALPGGHSRRRARAARARACSPATSPPAPLRRRGRGDHDRRRAAPRPAELGWDAAVCGPGPGILGSGSALGHGGMAALDTAHAALALGLPTVVLCARMSSGDPRARHRGLSHHTRTVLELLLAPVTVALPPGRAADGVPRGTGHEVLELDADVERLRASGLPARTMGRASTRTALFFARGAGRRARRWLRRSRAMSAERPPLRAARRPRRSTRAASSTVASSASATPTARRSSARSSATRARSRSSPTTTSTSGSCASRARRSATPTARDPRRASSTRRASRRWTRQARAGRGDRAGRRALGADLRASASSVGVHRRAVHVFLATGLCDARRAGRGRRERAHRDRPLAAGRPRRARSPRPATPRR